MNNNYCFVCFTKLSKDEKALSKKLLGRNVSRLFCLSCLSEYLNCTVEDLKLKIELFREEGCGLFKD